VRHGHGCTNEEIQMKIYLKNSVWDAALERINRIFDEFDNVVISSSGGKDSTVTMELALMVAKERGRSPMKLMFLDQEAEYRMTIEYMRKAMARDDIEPIWVQAPIRLFNATSMKDPWLWCWRDGDEWMRPKEDISVKENVFGTDRFHDIFPKIIEYYFPDESACYLAGVRAEESPQRLAGLTTGQTYKDITWGKVLNKKLGHYTFYPLFDWCLSDIWKAIHDHGWDYCQIYDELYRYGMAPHKMRVSNLHHETAVHSLFFLHELEGDTWDALTKRLGGINQAKHMQKEEMFAVKNLPYMFKNWREYRDYLTDQLITIPENREKFHKEWKKMDGFYEQMTKPEDLHKKQIASILCNDWEFVKLAGFMNSPPMITYRDWRRGNLGARARTLSNLIYVKEQYHHEARITK
jgi:predicted phosphoadenosine phosphosulfate sulfurtransferase